MCTCVSVDMQVCVRVRTFVCVTVCVCVDQETPSDDILPPALPTLFFEMAVSP